MIGFQRFVAAGVVTAIIFIVFCIDLLTFLLIAVFQYR
jgi:hypothetical protein